MKKFIYTFLAIATYALGATAQAPDSHISVFRDMETAFTIQFDSIRLGNLNARPLSFEADNEQFFNYYNLSPGYQSRLGKWSDAVSVKPEYESLVSGGKFFYASPYYSSNPIINYHIGRNYGRYDIHVVLVPDFYACGEKTITDSENGTSETFDYAREDTVMHRLRATLYYGKASGRWNSERSATIEYDGTSVQDIVLLEDFEFPAYDYTAEKEAFWTDPLGSEDMLVIESTASTSSLKRGYGRNLCIDRIYLVPREDGVEGLPGMFVYGNNSALALDKKEMQSILMTNVNINSVEAKVNPTNYADVEITTNVSGLKELWDNDIQPTYGIEIVSMSTVDANGQEYSTTDMKSQLLKDAWWGYDYHVFCNAAPYAILPFQEETGKISKTEDYASLTQPLPALLPNSTVGYRAYVEIGGTRIYSQYCEFHTPGIKASLLKMEAPRQEVGTLRMNCAVDASDLMERMNKVTVPNLSGETRMTFVDQRNYMYFLSQATGNDKEFGMVNEYLYYRLNNRVSRISEQDIYVDTFESDYDNPSQTMKYRMLVFLPDYSLDSWSGSSNCVYYKNSYNDDSSFDNFLDMRSIHTICYAVEFDEGGVQQPYTTFRFDNPAEAVLAGSTKTLLQELIEDGNFTTYVRLMCDPDVNLGQYLSDNATRTTAYASDDKAWERFFRQNAELPTDDYWHGATSYDALTCEQKNLLARYSLLTYLYKAEDLTTDLRPISYWEPQSQYWEPQGHVMRRKNLTEPINQIVNLPAEEVPHTYSATEKDYWERFRKENGGNGLLLATDATSAMTFVMDKAFLNNNKITDDDYRIVYGKEIKDGDILVGESPLREVDGITKNAYLNVVSDVIRPRRSMAEVIRTNGKTDIFSHMLDRYSAPFYSQELTEQYRELHPSSQDSVFVKRYFSDNSAGHAKLDVEPGPNGTTLPYHPYKDDTSKDIIPYLRFDPGWNEYHDDYVAEKDMAAMFVPSDEVLWKYFTEGGGMQFIRTYYIKEGTDEEIPYQRPTTVDDLYRQIDYIPLGTLRSLINIIMFRSFVGTVPSKMTELRDDAQEPFFYPEDIDKIDTCILASNGAVYVMDEIYGPLDYTSVTSPAYISTTNNIMKWAIYDERYMGLNYHAYLKDRQSEFTFFLPSDDAMQYYYDPVSMKSRAPRVLTMTYKNQTFPITARGFNYNSPYNVKGDLSLVGTIGNALQGMNATINQSDIINRLKDILESHTIVHDGTNPIRSEDNYYVSKNGNAIKIIRDEEGNIIEAKGGFQIENERNGIVSSTPGITSNIVTKSFDGLWNGQTYVLDSPLVPTYRSVWSIFTNDMMEDQYYNPYGYSDEAWEQNPYRAFYELCMFPGSERLIKGCGLVSQTLTTEEQKSAMKKFRIFTNTDNANGLDYNVQFFNNYHYTIFVPTNDAIKDAIAKGLPTWEDIEKDYNSHCNSEGNLQTSEDSLRIQTKITYLTNFIRNHFADSSVFADNTEIADKEMVTASYDSDNERFCKIHVDRIKAGDKTKLRVCDDETYLNGDKNNKIETVDKVNGKDVRNILARDISCNKAPRGTSMTGISIDASSAAVIHVIDGVLNHTALVNGRYDSTWQSKESCKRYLKRYGARE